ncbi:hypothetical protein A2X44_04945 [candidate division CPR3 bacterium GWF2_35_18]|uniref:Ferredoxin n=1 Tax=candidate division CPR3 bacterium GW2011_GWF2_35_18 TaxID=1618350 RepID=A0A0G0C0Y6_UNCC3|nr:MAG: hypothetical protein UR67_C0003G0069 [candidate division CPR3 bacterium GW2011_GWF2_35_18]OGB63681.1 MAG: hypothetical protein A2X44_04945 [candidate division CPR3 bacterium GWF2_35_18]OGB64999.1 MAG: hypothetical protein A2250_01100 [candidate division CPR3 bacterium RIFOXYA2_FULL_35_13]OGB76591.1 MAG: hypothetical protein A2476_01390 [candidate division CPR3 bacterium RIFOXYC2_FULL_35_7]OGB79125.1 MAG: hypothetical protein A2296_04440 [candidate division CPR3 bacterium RIFOXYB2_FULL_3
MKKVKVTFNHETCIGTGTCATLTTKYWQMGDDTKSQLIGGSLNKKTKVYELTTEVDDEDYSILKETQQFCPSQSISVKEIK